MSYESYELSRLEQEEVEYGRWAEEWLPDGLDDWECAVLWEREKEKRRGDVERQG